MRLQAIVAVTLGVSLAPFTAAAAPDGDDLAAPDEAAGDVPAATPEGPEEGPSVATPPPAANSSAPEPEYKGKGLIGAAIGVTALSWVSRITALGLTLKGCSDLEGCTNRFGATAAFLYLAPISQFVATGLVVPGGLLKGRHDGWRQLTTGAPDRNGKTYVIAGGVLFGVFTAVSIVLRPAYTFGCLNSAFEGDPGCASKGGIAGYYLGVQISDTLSTTGAGLMSYGIGYNGYKRRYGPKVSLAPFGGRGSYGLSLTARF